MPQSNLVRASFHVCYDSDHSFYGKSKPLGVHAVDWRALENVAQIRIGDGLFQMLSRMLDVETNTVYVFLIPADGTNKVTREVALAAGRDAEQAAKD